MASVAAQHVSVRFFYVANGLRMRDLKKYEKRAEKQLSPTVLTLNCLKDIPKKLFYGAETENIQPD